LAPALLAAAVIVLGTGHASGRLAENVAIQHIGTISYSLYLWHWPLVVCWRLTFGDDPTQSYEVLILLAATWLAAWLSWRFVEQPFRTRVAWRPNRSMYAAYGTLIAAFAAVTVPITRTDGMPRRLPDYLEGARTAAAQNEKLEQCWDLPGASPRLPRYACDVGAPREMRPTFAVWGDSHALQYMGALRRAVGPLGISGFLFHWPGCEPAFPDQARGDACDAHNAQVLHLIESTPSISTVVIAIRQNDTGRVDRSMRTAERLLEKNYRVVFVGPLPEARSAVAQEWARAELLRREAIPEMTIARTAQTRVASFDERLAYWQRGVTALAARHPGKLATLDLSDLFCDAGRCWLVRDGVANLRDAFGARQVVPRIASALAVPATASALTQAAR
jgi:hypothetical protein